MRIVGGKFRGRALTAPRSQNIRPTTDRTREALFNILAHGYDIDFDGKRVLDLFAGTGAVGLEALSRGAAFALFVEQSAEGRGLVRANMEALGVHGRAKLYRRDATALGSAGNLEPFDFVFADPPYGKGLGERALAGAASGGWLEDNALVVLEERSDIEPGLNIQFHLVERREFGDTAMHFYRFNGTVTAD
ncbi:16S rRNA (guanine(966)-N(2))-methyltransferase RsmD [Hoeflea sp. TYP-13]|uniref:16S rRNA (guanine(966)-N(2))-methyltransferase RsmD n=1 Tax=Hoeflea sp. TYP-13 TaxID=3230023 RepID=UPI0034C5E48C